MLPHGPKCPLQAVQALGDLGAPHKGVFQVRGRAKTLPPTEGQAVGLGRPIGQCRRQVAPVDQGPPHRLRRDRRRGVALPPARRSGQGSNADRHTTEGLQPLGIGRREATRPPPRDAAPPLKGGAQD
eukprot:13363774-Alexandrium_andersonii.AAC.1